MVGSWVEIADNAEADVPAGRRPVMSLAVPAVTLGFMGLPPAVALLVLLGVAG